jgi:Fic family protein
MASYDRRVDAGRYKTTQFGRATQKPGDKWAFTYYKPEPIPRDVVFERDTVYLLSEADNALGHLEGLGRLIPQPDLLVGPFLTREAIASSRIEGTNASLPEVLKAQEVTPDPNADVVEVQRYLAAIELGLKLIKTLPISQRLIKQVHGVLLEEVRGKEREPGSLRRSPVWIGGSAPTNALFVAPIPDHLPELLADWERFVNEPNKLPLLVRAALMHYQFETIHPFLDGNGRIGRLLIVLLLVTEGRLSSPFLYLSGYMETHRRDYYDRLQGVRETGDIQSWIQFFCQAVHAQSEDAVARAGRIIEIRERYYKQITGDRSSIGALVPLMLENPFITARRVQRAVNVTSQGARNLIERAENYGWLKHAGSFGSAGRNYYAATEILNAIDAPTTYGTDEQWK